MRHRWADANNEDPNNGPVDNDGGQADFVGCCGCADLWVVPNMDVLICQYEDPDEYVSYHPASAVLDHAKGVLTYENTPRLGGVSVTDPQNVDKRLLWIGMTSSVIGHYPKDIARYLAVFTPGIFTEDEREEALGLTLTEQGERK